MNYTRQVGVVMFLAFSVFAIGSGYRKAGNGNYEFNIPSNTSLAAWALLTVMFMALTDIEQTGELAEALSWLFLLSVLMLYGEKAFEQFNRWIGQTGTDSGPASDKRFHP